MSRLRPSLRPRTASTADSQRDQATSGGAGDASGTIADEGGELAARDARFRDADSQFAGLRTAYDAQKRRNGEVAQSWRRGVAAQVTPAIADPGATVRRCRRLPVGCGQCRRRRRRPVALWIRPRILPTSRASAPPTSNGSTGRVSAPSEVACLADDDLVHDARSHGELQVTQVDLPEIRTDARRLADESGSVGQDLGRSATGCDFEPIDGTVRSSSVFHTVGSAPIARWLAPRPSTGGILSLCRNAQPDYQS